MLRYRIPTGLFVTFACYFGLSSDAANMSSTWLSVIIAAVCLPALWEFYTLAEAKGVKPHSWFGMVMMVALIYSHDRWGWEKWHDAPRSVPDLMSTVLVMVVMGCFLLQGLRKDKIEGAILGIGSTLMGLIYCWFLPSYFIKMRHLGVHGDGSWARDGVEFVLLTMFVSKFCDVGAFFVGRKFGKHKMSPMISPAKSWEGFFGGLAASVAMILVWREIIPGTVLAVWHPAVVVALGLVLAIGSVLGDLVESIFKRDSRMKDAGSLVPGYGGMLDLIDSLMVSAPLAYFFFVLAGASPGGN